VKLPERERARRSQLNVRPHRAEHLTGSEFGADLDEQADARIEERALLGHHPNVPAPALDREDAGVAEVREDRPQFLLGIPQLPFASPAELPELFSRDPFPLLAEPLPELRGYPREGEHLLESLMEIVPHHREGADRAHQGSDPGTSFLRVGSCHGPSEIDPVVYPQVLPQHRWAEVLLDVVCRGAQIERVVVAQRVERTCVVNVLPAGERHGESVPKGPGNSSPGRLGLVPCRRVSSRNKKRVRLLRRRFRRFLFGPPATSPVVSDKEASGAMLTFPFAIGWIDRLPAEVHLEPAVGPLFGGQRMRAFAERDGPVIRLLRHDHDRALSARAPRILRTSSRWIRYSREGFCTMRRPRRSAFRHQY
jgi:hypothetical protein